jgi:hypothetical protein
MSECSLQLRGKMKANRARKKRFQREMTTDSEQNTQNEHKIYISLTFFYIFYYRKFICIHTVFDKSQRIAVI